MYHDRICLPYPVPKLIPNVPKTHPKRDKVPKGGPIRAQWRPNLEKLRKSDAQGPPLRKEWRPTTVKCTKNINTNDPRRTFDRSQKDRQIASSWKSPHAFQPRLRSENTVFIIAREGSKIIENVLTI